MRFLFNLYHARLAAYYIKQSSSMSHSYLVRDAMLSAHTRHARAIR
jgi:hypothetical protein